MSQEKVDKYKDYKKNKKKILAKEKRKKTAATLIVRLVGILVVAGVLVGVGLWGIGKYRTYLDSRPDYSSTNYLIGDICGITIEDETTQAAEQETGTEPETEENS